VKTCDNPKRFIALNNRPNSFWVSVSHKQFLFSISFKPRTFISGVFIKTIFQQFIAVFKFIKVFHAQILLRSFENVPGEMHNKTFVVKAKSIQQRGSEWFQLESVTHTTRPSLNQFDRLLTDGTVTMDHLIKRKADGRVTEKGPLLKIDRPRIGELFLGEPRNYFLVS
jgi:hypothetical protein